MPSLIVKDNNSDGDKLSHWITGNIVNKRPLPTQWAYLSVCLSIYPSHVSLILFSVVYKEIYIKRQKPLCHMSAHYLQL